MHMMHRST